MLALFIVNESFPSQYQSFVPSIVKSTVSGHQWLGPSIKSSSTIGNHQFKSWPHFQKLMDQDTRYVLVNSNPIIQTFFNRTKLLIVETENPIWWGPKTSIPYRHIKVCDSLLLFLHGKWSIMPTYSTSRTS